MCLRILGLTGRKGGLQGLNSNAHLVVAVFVAVFVTVVVILQTTIPILFLLRHVSATGTAWIVHDGNDICLKGQFLDMTAAVAVAIAAAVATVSRWRILLVIVTGRQNAKCFGGTFHNALQRQRDV